MSARSTARLAAPLALLAALFITTPAHAQFDRLRRAVTNAAQTVDPARLLQTPPPISTNLADAVWGADSLDGHNPDPSIFKPLAVLPRTASGGFVLQAGHFAQQNQSYCLRAGTHGPGAGDGYLFAPPRGPAEDQVMTIVRNSAAHPDIDQHDVQLLLWAIIARAKFENLDHRLQVIAARLLAPEQILSLNRSALELAGPALQHALDGMPEPVQQVMRAEAGLRDELTSANASYENAERLAVLAGVAPRGEGSRDIPHGRWSLHPDGYFVRYLPSAYYSTRIEIWVPEGSPAIGREFDPARHIAVPGNTAQQRLIQSARERGS